MQYKVIEQAGVHDMHGQSLNQMAENSSSMLFSAWDLRTLYVHMQAFLVNAPFLKPDCSEPNILLIHKCFFNLLPLL